MIVSHEMVDASDGATVAFSEVGPVALKGLSAPIVLYAAARPSRADQVGANASSSRSRRPTPSRIAVRISGEASRSSWNI